MCCKVETDLLRLLGKTDAISVQARAKLLKGMQEHEKIHLAARQELDDAGLQAVCNPRMMWTIIVDAATQRNFNLPKFKGRMPKAFTKLPFWEFKLMCVYAYGYGFCPYLVHKSQSAGANLTWTVIWEVLCDMRAYHGFYAEVLHIQLDNTKSDNKNYLMIAMSAWLVKTGRFKRVRVFFLLVGHTHVIIDQIFGAITKGTVGDELITPQDMIANINGTCADNPAWMAKPVKWLHCVFDYTTWYKTHFKLANIERIFDGDISCQDGSYAGMNDFLFFAFGEHEQVLLQYRESASHSYWPKNSPGIETIQGLPLVPPEFQKVHPKSKWGKLDRNTLEDTIAVAMVYTKDLLAPEARAHKTQEWHQCVTNIPTIMPLIKPELKLPFRDFEIPAFRLTHNGAAGTSEETEFERAVRKDFTEWCAENFSMRTEPLPFDPVISSQQSRAEADRQIEAYKVLVGGQEPTLSKNSPIFDGSYHLVTIPTHVGVELVKCCALPRGCGPRTLDSYYTVRVYNHKPNKTVSGLFGTFDAASTPNPEKPSRTQEVRFKIHRDNIHVFNVDLIPRKRILSLRSLRVLATVLPDSYPMPEAEDIPDDHVATETDGVQTELPRQTVQRRNKTAAGRAPPQPRSRSRGAAGRLRLGARRAEGGCVDVGKGWE